MFKFFEIKNTSFNSPFRSHRGGMRRLVRRQLAKALIRREEAEVELSVQHYDEVKKQKRSA